MFQSGCGKCDSHADIHPKMYSGRSIAVFTSGGDSQGMNSAVRAVVRWVMRPTVFLLLPCRINLSILLLKIGSSNWVNKTRIHYHIKALCYKPDPVTEFIKLRSALKLFKMAMNIMRNVRQQKGNKLAAILRNTWNLSTFLLSSKKMSQ